MLHLWLSTNEGRHSRIRKESNDRSPLCVYVTELSTNSCVQLGSQLFSALNQVSHILAILFRQTFPSHISRYFWK